MSDFRAALVSATAGLVGVVAGAVISGVSSWKLAAVQVEQERIRVSASTALALRAELSQKVSNFSGIYQVFIDKVRTEKTSLSDLNKEAERLGEEASKLLPYLDGDLFIACQSLADSAFKLSRAETIGDLSSAQAGLIKSEKEFWILYLRLKRKLEADAHIDIMSTQIFDK
ncbi:hypothetical protein PSEUDO8Z_60046 [Pseudomonas sp. 8Z]|uniref:hypothetical protein n=1 Tax=Pseudomonas sp. 8Z TaxID=2653166 RepID=UPI0012F197B4|nr:hypothetical protein [Pseudomonas sp. 8Z]VXC94809.1 hypothetical protein PSEUDO8Z_60046 [Pseudomonas sp. 8Z]